VPDGVTNRIGRVTEHAPLGAEGDVIIWEDNRLRMAIQQADDKNKKIDDFFHLPTQAED